MALQQKTLQQGTKTAFVFLLMVAGFWLPTNDNSASAQDLLPRRAFFGAGFETDTNDGSINITTVFEGSSAAEAGLLLGDVVEHVDGQSIASVEALVSTIGGHEAGDVVSIGLRRGGNPIEISVALLAYPTEEIDGCEVIYDAVPSPDSAWLRTIVARPTSGDGPFPAVLMIQGLRCTSIDSPFPEYRGGFVEISHRLCQLGYVTLRVEKSGIGDSGGEACSEIDLHTELQGYQAGLDALFAYPFADSEAVFIFGHSMGGVMAPLVAVDRSVRGIAVFGTIGRNLFDYLLENHERQLSLQETEDTALEAEMAVYSEFVWPLLAAEMTPSQVFETLPHLDGVIEAIDGDHFHGRHIDFFHQLQALQIPQFWSTIGTGTRVLALHGSFDWIASAVDHRLIAGAAELYVAPAQYLSIEGMDHAFTIHETLEDGIANLGQGEFGDVILAILEKWIEGVRPQQ